MIERETVIKASPQKVWSLLADHERMPEWAGMKSVVITDRKNGVGLKCACDFGRFQAYEEVVEWVPSRKIVHRITAMGMPMRETWLIESVSSGTKFRWRQEIEVRGLKKVISFLIRRQLAGAFDRALTRLKAQLEA